MNWKYFAMVGVEKEFDSLDNQVVYCVYVSNDFEKSSEVVGVCDGYDVINEVSFVPRPVGKIKGKEFIVTDTAYLSSDPFIAQILIPTLKNFQVEKVKTTSWLSDQVRELFTSAGFKVEGR